MSIVKPRRGGEGWEKLLEAFEFFGRPFGAAIFAGGADFGDGGGLDEGLIGAERVANVAENLGDLFIVESGGEAGHGERVIFSCDHDGTADPVEGDANEA